MTATDVVAWVVIALFIAFAGALWAGDPSERWGYLKAVAGILILEALVVVVVAAVAAFAWALSVVST